MRPNTVPLEAILSMFGPQNLFVTKLASSDAKKRPKWYSAQILKRCCSSGAAGGAGK
jgi:hypothetical protein